MLSSQTFHPSQQHVCLVHFHVVPKPDEKEGLILDIEKSWPQQSPDETELEATQAKMVGRLG
ncbi:uncharacterized protein BT62DRAFT_929429 [Guyanagaster necrorhizus]|uniref:HIT domain-containing protein n=1 Tax=Guyanagaster necrorhizus TaxID=856835 RepID=A0A9P8AX17_9AGAR|nr:uncharacterized protein BT62DRAFT_929429 [Guyanagaster necrorhizus MCA 3950]KAG7449467.1 hypothetical protein BT62DRAFT_929429 [Guyanagaster necrorhizus MCA 3950]